MRSVLPQSVAARVVTSTAVGGVRPTRRRLVWWRLVGLALATVATATLLTWAVRLFAADTLFIFFVAAVAVTSWAGGHRAGLLATLLSALVVDYVFVPPFGALIPLHTGDGVRLASFVAVASLIAVLSGALHRARDRTEGLRMEADAARAAADQASAVKGEFLATMSHELRTPINAVIGYAELLELGAAGAVSDTQIAHLTRIRTAGRHLLTLVNDVLDLEKAQAGRLTVEVGAWHFADAADGAHSLVLPQARAKGVSLVVPGRPERPGADAYLGDPARVQQIVVNLLANAIKFTPQGGTITVTWGVDGCGAEDGARRAESSGGRVWLRVADTGIGIAPADHGRVFEPFEQVASGRTRVAGGTGLGLAISRRLARLMGGDLTLESEVEHGSTFTLWLPAAADGAAGRT